MNYEDFIKSKEHYITNRGFIVERNELNNNMFEFQKDIVRWALRRGQAAIFADCGLGKTLMQLEWANKVFQYTGNNVLILTPLSVAKQTIRESEKFGIEVTLCRSEGDIRPGINITNYEMLHAFNVDDFIGIVLDESSILKSFTGKMRNEIIEEFKNTPYRLACTATPAPNDYMELGNHSEFLGVMTRTEMLSMFFIHDGGDTAKWRLKGHAQDKFWEWMASWAVTIENPNNLGYLDSDYNLPELKINEIVVEADNDCNTLIPKLATTLSERREARKGSLQNRIDKIVDLTLDSLLDGEDKWLVWCDYNYEQDALNKALHDQSVSIEGSTPYTLREEYEEMWRVGDIPVLITKPMVMGWGMNWQHCNNMIFFGISDSYEQFYQAIRRCWRFGQNKEVNVYVIIGEKESTVLDNIKRKQKDADIMKRNMLRYSKNIRELAEFKEEYTKTYEPKIPMKLPNWI